jgi:hypothetical protein
MGQITRFEQWIQRSNQIYLDNMQREIDNAKYYNERVVLQKKRDERLELVNKNKTDRMSDFV